VAFKTSPLADFAGKGKGRGLANACNQNKNGRDGVHDISRMKVVLLIGSYSF
jgi:hypothetical protein